MTEMTEEQWCCLYAKQAVSDGGPVVHDDQCTAPKTVTVFRRRICWPDPDATCLEGGCIWCKYERPRDFDSIESYAAKAGIVQNRGHGEQDAMTAWRTGVQNGFFGKDLVSEVKRKVKA